MRKQRFPVFPSPPSTTFFHLGLLLLWVECTNHPLHLHFHLLVPKICLKCIRKLRWLLNIWRRWKKLYTHSVDEIAYRCGFHTNEIFARILFGTANLFRYSVMHTYYLNMWTKIVCFQQFNLVCVCVVCCM